MKWLALPVLGALALFSAPASAQDYRYHSPTHQRYHDALEHRDLHRSLEHRDTHRFPLTWRQHERLHGALEHDRYHGRQEHRQVHRPAYDQPYRGVVNPPSRGYEYPDYRR